MGVTTRAVVIFVLSCTLAASAAGIVRTSALDESTVRLPGVAGFLHPEARFPADAGLDGTPAKEWATQRFSKLSNKGFDLISSVDGVRRLVLSLLSEEIDPIAVHTPATEPLPWDAQARALAAAGAPVRPRVLPVVNSPANTSGPCSGVGKLLGEASNQYTCNSTQVPYLAYDAITFLQDVSSSNGNNTGLRTVLLDVADVLTGFNVSLAGIVPADTGIFVNLSDLFTGSLLSEVESNLNLTDTQQLIDVGKLFQNNVDGSPVVNLTDLVQALPINTLQNVIARISCTKGTQDTSVCVCPVDFLPSGNCSTARNYTCTPSLNFPPSTGYEACLASNGHLPPPNAPAGHHHTHTYDPRSDGDPPCLYVDPTIGGSALTIPLSLVCSFSDGLGNYPFCNGTALTERFITNQATARNLTIPELPGSPPFYDFGCLEAEFTYTTGGPNANGTGVSFTGPPANLTLTIHPYNFKYLSESVFEVSVPLPLTLYSYLTAWNTSVSLPLDNLPVREYFPGGRLYIEVFVDELSTDTVPANGSAAFSSPPAARIVVDDRNYVQGRLHSLNVGLIIGLLVPFGLLMFGTAFWYHRRLAKQRDAAHLAFLQQQVDVHAISYSAMMDPQDITKKQLRYRGNKARHGWF